MRNLEIKVQVQLEKVVGKLSFATYIKKIYQKDSYFLVGGKRLKLREEAGNLEFIFYIRPDTSSSKESKYFRFLVPSFLQSFFRKSFDFVFGKKVEVTKERTLFLFKNTRIHLDKVKNVGEFVELETVFNKNHDEQKGSFILEHNQVKKYLGLEAFTVIPGSYSDMVLENNQ